MRKAATFAILGFVLALVFGMMAVIMRNRIAVVESIADAQALWNEERLFIVVQKRVAVQKANRLLRKLSEVSGTLFPQPRFLPEDLIVFQIESGKVERLEQRRIGRVGGAFPLNGTVHFLRGSDPSDYPCVFRLTGSNVVRLQKHEAEAVVGSFQTESELVKREGWQKRDLYFTEGQAEYPVEQKRRKLKIVLSKSRQSGTVKIELVDEGAQATQTLLQLSSRSREVSAEEIRQLNAKSQ